MSEEKQNRVADWLDDLEDAPPIECSRKERKRQNYRAPGWKYYVSIQPQLQGWWDEFTGTLSKGKLKYKSLKQFVDSRTKNREHRQFLIYMLGPRPDEDSSDKHSIQNMTPWIGDWYKRRKNGYWVEENSKYLKHLAKAIREQTDNASAIRATVPFIVKSLMRIERMHDKIDEAFGGQPFLDEDPTKKASGNRFRVYTKMHEYVESQKRKVVYDWMRVHGVDPYKPSEMWNMAQLAEMAARSGAAGAITGAFAGMQVQQSPPGIPAGFNLTKDALLVAMHLTDHARTFRKPLPEGLTIDMTESTKEEKKTNGKHTQ